MSNIKLNKAPVEGKYIKDSRETRLVALVAAITAFLTIGALVAVVVWHAVLEFTTSSTGTPAFFRAVLLSMNGIFAVNLLSLWFDRPRYELFDVYTAIIIGILTILVDAYLLVTELQRVFDCPTGMEHGPLSQLICNSFASQQAIVPWFSVAVVLLFAIGLLMLAIWYYTNKPKSTTNDGRSRLKKIRESFKESSNIAIAVIAAIMILVIIATVFISLFPVNGTFMAAMYRGTFLIIPAHYAGAELAFFALTPPSWTIICLVFGFLSLASLIIGMILELPRMIHCSLGTGTPTVLDQGICNNEGWLAFWLPSVYVFLTILGVVTLILLFVRVFSKVDKTTKTDEQPLAEPEPVVEEKDE
jgi:hypothetical protein